MKKKVLFLLLIIVSIFGITNVKADSTSSKSGNDLGEGVVNKECTKLVIKLLDDRAEFGPIGNEENLKTMYNNNSKLKEQVDHYYACCKKIADKTLPAKAPEKLTADQCPKNSGTPEPKKPITPVEPQKDDDKNQIKKEVCTELLTSAGSNTPMLNTTCVLLLNNIPCADKECYKKYICGVAGSDNFNVKVPESYCPSNENKKDPQNNDGLDETKKKLCKDLLSTNSLSNNETAYTNCINALNGSNCTTEECLKKYICNTVGTGQFSSMKKPSYCNNGGNGGGGTGGGGNGGGSNPTPTPKEPDPSTDCAGFEGVVYYGAYVIKIIHLVIPVLLIIWASIDLLRSIISGDEKKIQNARKPVIQRFVSAVLIFLLPWLVSVVIGAASNQEIQDWKTCFNKAWSGGAKNSDLFDIRKW